MRSSVPFEETITCPQWLVLLVSECDGSKTAQEVHTSMNTHGSIDADDRTAVLRLVSAGVLQVSSGNRLRSSG